jgi:excisionase family DNA binding protein
MDSAEKWYSVKEAAHLLSVSVDTVRRLIGRRLLRALRLPVSGNRRKRTYVCWRIAGSDLARFMRVNMNF